MVQIPLLVVTFTPKRIGLLAQAVSLLVMVAIGVAVKVMRVESLAAIQFPFPVVVCTR